MGASVVMAKESARGGRSGQGAQKGQSAPADLCIRLLGTVELRRGGAELPLPPSRRTRALLGYLVATATPQLRSALCDLLWEGPDDPRAALRWSLTKLRAIVDDAAAQRLLADRERAGFVALHCQVDTVRVHSLLAAGVETAALEALEEAARLLQGEFLDGLDLPACYRFHHWCMAERERHGALRRRLLEALVARLAGEPQRALPYGRAMVAADPLAEAAHATLVRLLAAAGHYPEAERHHEWARDLLQREVALPAGGPLDDAIHRARRELRAAAATPVPVPQAEVAASSEALPRDAPQAVPQVVPQVGPDATPAAAAPQAAPLPAPPLHDGPPQARPLLGRAAERRAVAELLAAGRGRRRLLFFAGEPGIGKTRLLDHLAEGAAAAGRRVIRGRCFEAEMVRPYGLWLDALRGVATEGVPPETLAEAAPLLAGQRVEGGNRERLFDAAAALLRSMAEVQPLALLLDDLQWIDEGSAALLHFLARTQQDGAAALIFAGAARAGEIDDNRWAKGLLQSLRRTDGLQRLDLGPLGESEARTLLGGAAIDAALALRQSGGNPLFLIELVRAAGRGGEGSGRSIDALIDERLAALEDGERYLLGWAAALGREIQPELLAAAAGVSLTEVLARFERCERRGLLAPTGQGQLDFAHDLVRQAVYRSMSQPHRRAVHRQITRVLQAASADDPWLHGEIVRHAGLADDALAAARACLAAGEHCLRVFANAEATGVAELGLEHVGALAPGPERVRLEIGLLRLRVSAAAGPEGARLPALTERIESAIAAAEALALHAEAAAGWEILAFVQQRSSEPDKTLASTLAAERLTQRADPATHCQQLANSGRCLLDIEADPVRGRALLEEASELAAALGLRVMEIEWGRGLLARNDGDLDGARESLAGAVALARAAENHWREYECMVWLATVELEQGRFADVLRHVQEILAAAALMGDMPAPFAQGLAALARLRMREGTGDAVHEGAGDAAHEGAGDGPHEGAGEDAGEALAASLAALRALDDKAHLAYLLNEAAALALGDGRPEAAAACADEALAAARAVRRPSEVAVALARLVSAGGGAAAEAPSRAALRAASRAAATGARAAPGATTLVPTPAQ